MFCRVWGSGGSNSNWRLFVEIGSAGGVAVRFNATPLCSVAYYELFARVDQAKIRIAAQGLGALTIKSALAYNQCCTCQATEHRDFHGDEPRI